MAGVSKATVSRVLNGKPDVSPETKARIEAVIEQFSYSPQQAALALATGRSRLVGLSFGSIQNRFLSALATGIDTTQEKHGLDVVLYVSRTASRRGELIHRAVRSGFVEGMICMFPGRECEFLEEQFRNGFPSVVLLGCRETKLQLPCVGIDNRAAAHDAMRHLLRLGHRRIAILPGPPEFQEFQLTADRLLGCKEALEEAGIAFDSALVKTSSGLNGLEVGGYVCAHELLTSGDPATAVFAFADEIALGVLRAAAEIGVSVPDQLAVVGFDDIPEASAFRPALTTVSQPTTELVKAAMRLLVEQAEKGTEWATDITLPTRLIVRDSCGA